MKISVTNIAVWMLAAVLLMSAAKAENDQLTEAEINAKRLWVKEVEAENFHFWRRYFRQPQNFSEPPLEWYSPIELVPGGIRPYFEEAKWSKRTIRDDALEAALDYAKEQNSHTFIVLHQNIIQLAWFDEGMHAAATVSSHSFVKTLASILVGIAIADGEIDSIDDPIGSYVNEWKDDPRGKTTIRQALQMTSGFDLSEIRNMSPAVYGPFSRETQMVNGSDVDGTVLTWPYESKPGDVFAHFNPSPQLLGIVLARATGVRYTTYLSEKLWRPMGAVRGAMRLDGIGGQPIMFCCYLSTPSDWLRLGHLLINDGRINGEQIIPVGWVKEMKTTSQVNPNYGYQIWVGSPPTKERKYLPTLEGMTANYHSEPFDGGDIFYMEGSSKFRMWMVPSEELVVLRMGLNPPDMDEARLPNTILRGIKKLQSQ